MIIDCDMRLVGLDPSITFEDGTIWRIPISEWERMMDIILPPSIRKKYWQTDYCGYISKRRYNNAEKHYQAICKTFRRNK